MDRRTDTEKAMDRFLEGFHDWPTERHVWENHANAHFFLDFLRRWAPTMTKEEIVDMLNQQRYEFRADEWTQGMSQDDYNQHLPKIEQRQREVLLNKCPYKFFIGGRAGPLLLVPESWEIKRTDHWEGRHIDKVWVDELYQPKEKPMDKKGLYHKFDVRSARTGEAIHSTFVLMPEKDPAACLALETYMNAVRPEAPELANDIMKWLTYIELKKLADAGVPSWAKEFFADPWKKQRDGEILMLIEAGPGRGKTTLGIKAGIQRWMRDATYPPTTKPGLIVVPNFMQLEFVCHMLLTTFHGWYCSRQERKIQLATSTGVCQIQVHTVDSPALEGIHKGFDWVFFDNIDMLPNENKIWRIVDRIDPRMLILSQSKHSFAMNILANRCEWNVLTSPDLL